MKNTRIKELFFFDFEFQQKHFNLHKKVDNKIIQKIYSKRLIIFDLDGTIDGTIDGEYTIFRKIDNEIIHELFFNSSLVMNLDLMLWKINEKDIISNSMKLFTLRMLIYSILAGKNPKKVLGYYEKRYIEISRKYIFEKFSDEILSLEKIGFKVVVFSHNVYTEGISVCLPIKALKNKGKCIKELNDLADIAYIVGNNFTDDIRPAQKLGVKAIYVGNSKILQSIAKKNLIVVENTTKAINEIFKREEPRK
jgi:FMN phosphatase YigB (HAD superfamily)